MPSSIGGADGVRTHDLLDAIEARSQLRHGPTDANDFKYFTLGAKPRLCPFGDRLRNGSV